VEGDGDIVERKVVVGREGVVVVKGTAKSGFTVIVENGPVGKGTVELASCVSGIESGAVRGGLAV